MQTVCCGKLSCCCKQPFCEWQYVNSEVLTQAVMKEPVIAADGHTYEKAAILDWLQLHAESPVTGEALSDHTVLPNIVMHGLLTDQD